MTYEDWIHYAGASVEALSRTANGVNDPSLSHDKPGLSIESGPALRAQAAANIRRAVDFAWHSRDSVRGARELCAFIETLAAQLNEGLVPADRPLLRTWHTKYSGPVAPEDVPAAFGAFCVKHATSLVHDWSIAEAIFMAAEIERDFNYHVHPLADGCGRVSRILGALVLLRVGSRPARFEDRTEYYALMRASSEAWHEAYERQLLRA
ncbi:MAG TPA: hypothetical protein VGB97_01150 [Candidatus Paceibacterota bacterium]|jgi:hypothetical protein